MNELPLSYRRTLSEMPDMEFGEDKIDYVRRVIAWGAEQGIGAVECSRCANMKWKSWEVERIITEIEDGNLNAIGDAVVMLLKDRYIV